MPLPVLPGDGLDRGSVFFVGTATVIIRYAGFTVLTDPNFLHAGDHVHIGYGLKAKRLTNPAIELDELPSIDFVLLSHLHEDHFDREVARRLDKGTPIVTTPQAAKALSKMGFQRTFPLRTWQSRALTRGTRSLTVTAMPGRHATKLVAPLMPPVMGSMLEFGRVGEGPLLRLYVSGDTILHEDLREIPRRYRGIDLALLHLGGTKVMGLVVTMDAQQGVQAVKLVNAKTNIPIHYDDYDRFKSPLSDFVKAVEDAGLTDRVQYLARGETYVFEVPRTRGDLVQARVGVPGEVRPGGPDTTRH